LKAELVGIMLGDGSISKRENGKGQNRIKISIDSREKQYIREIVELLNRILGKKPYVRNRKNEYTCNIMYFDSRSITFFLDNLNLIKSPKWNRAEIPEKYFKKEYYADILRGYFDTYGSVVITNNNGTKYPRLEMKICPAKMQKQLIKCTQELELDFKVYDLDKGKIRLQANGVQAVRDWFNKVGFRNKKHEKKATRFLKNKNCIAGSGFEPLTSG